MAGVAVVLVVVLVVVAVVVSRGEPEGDWTDVAVGSAHACGLRADGTVACWGANHNGQAEAPDGTFSAIDAAGDASCGLRTSGTVACWGRKSAGLDGAIQRHRG